VPVVVAVFSYLASVPLQTPIRTVSDGLGRRIQKIDRTGESDVTCDYYYNTSWQVLEVRRSDYTNHPYEQYVWDIRYVDAPVLRWHDASEDGDFLDTDETLYYTNDANMNVTALLNTDGSVVERYTYNAYGEATVRHGVRDAQGTDTSGSEWQPRTSNTFENAILFIPRSAAGCCAIRLGTRKL